MGKDTTDVHTGSTSIDFRVAQNKVVIVDRRILGMKAGEGLC